MAWNKVMIPKIKRRMICFMPTFFSYKNILSDEIPFVSYELNMNDDPEMNTISLTLFIAGCPRNCLGCQNESLKQIKINENCNLVSINYIKNLIKEKSILCKSVCFCGGDWLPWYENQLIKLINYCKELNLKTIVYTGELYNNIDEWIKINTSIIVSEPYIEELKWKYTFPITKNQQVHINNILIDPKDLKINNILS